ncbi:30S ribosomal protein S6 [Helicobacter monodelphidis]|uniref:30S ribosomal protein S6 n=1 Tax=Helicobacter sp. 15-1451 TaxID=2004995 RepID=UPI000DCBECB8|nr:30S ribosomal protein S6 [Helicobacter sp. 15-1451]RAX57145.1 30S ribosomal protein S6 [Helicobacter sp. 15-1451]
MKHYETMFIVKPTLTPEEIVAKIDFFKEAISKNGGENVATLDMGMRNLAYEIKKNKRGYYYVVYFKAPPALILELERLYRISEDILRFIVIKYENKKEQKAWADLVERAKRPKGDSKENPKAEAV